MSMSFNESPQLFTKITSDFFNFGEKEIACAKACDGSRDGEIFSNFETSL